MKTGKEEDLFQRAAGILKPLGALLLVVLLITGAFALHDYLGSFYYLVKVEGQVTGAVKDIAEVAEFVEELNETKIEEYGMEVVYVEKISSELVQDVSLEDNTEEVKNKLQDSLTYKTEAIQIVLNGKEIFTVHDEEEFNRVVELIKNQYILEDQDIVDVYIEDDIDYKIVMVSPHSIITAEEVVNNLLAGRNKRQVYYVSRGDSLGSIAQEKQVSVSELREANPQLEEKNLQEGEEINLTLREDLINVVVVEEVTREEKIAFDTEYSYDSSMWNTEKEEVTTGEHGLKEVTYKVTYKNGEEVEEEVVNEKVVKEPVTREIVKGTATPNPSGVIGTGRFIWPAASGRITSPFGPRGGGFHNGIDIASSRGTPIYAADSGVVTYSGYRGAYGRLVIIDHGNGYSTYYAHNTSNLVTSGQKVSQGQTIATMGVSGNATGSHLHFEIRRNGSPVNPMNYFNQR
ncbi:MAG: LysM peptidoglycan-binding domain-containing protein [Candidatus Syntrophonatronum acetioxidans]|uniref:LysM peptidoglycan-binding domain-containing protein n=1 Tax=Candidatus Syntrophonatronum acetioxidans TaxID=1795816 RepID=A0A424YFS0_9FIRM|nr:MAG: LysM peptidoglycan-binding domain-containing protein [Candidatus Syntrophonatronum acetioxidans]